MPRLALKKLKHGVVAETKQAAHWVSIVQCTMLTHLLSHWSSITLADLLTAAYLIFLILFVIGCNHLFTNFVDSKPEGRKTVLGQSVVL